LVHQQHTLDSQVSPELRDPGVPFVDESVHLAPVGRQLIAWGSNRIDRFRRLRRFQDRSIDLCRDRSTFDSNPLKTWALMADGNTLSPLERNRNWCTLAAAVAELCRSVVDGNGFEGIGDGLIECFFGS
jgi:hypothetical protein